MDYREDIFAARWHLDIAKRMFMGYDEYGGKRFLVGVINETAKAAGKIVRAFLIREKVKGNLETFVNVVGFKYLKEEEVEILVKILEIERVQKISRVEFSRGDEILLENKGNWKILKVKRLRDFVNVICKIVYQFPVLSDN